MDAPFDRRAFLKTAAGTLALLVSRQGLASAQAPAAAPIAGPQVRFAIVGLGTWGREILDALGRTETAQITGICDIYEPFLTRAAATAPKAETATDWRRLLESPTVDAIVIATPTPNHREIALAALQARKHVYCEAPIAASVEDARAIAAAAAGASGVVFQAGLQGR